MKSKRSTKSTPMSAGVKNARRIYIFDTTLRDGEQSPGASMSDSAKLEFAKQLGLLKVDAIEAGFAVSSPAQFEGVRQIALQVKGPRILSLARTIPGDIKAAADAVKPAKKPGIHTFIATSDIHLKHKLNKTREEALAMSIKAVKMAKDLSPYVEWSAEDATRSDWDYLTKIIQAVIDAGADAVNIPDTVGYTTPSEYGVMLDYLFKHVPDLNNVIVSVHCHNDLGMAVANSLTAIMHGVTQVECTINGIGERAGNCALEEVVMAIKTRADHFNAYANVDTREIYKTSKLLTKITGIFVQPNKAIVGDNAFAHESGIHQDGVIKYRQTYEIMKAEDVGVPSNKLVMGRHSGRHALMKKVEQLGYTLNEAQINDLYKRFLEIADKKREVYDDDIIALIESSTDKSPQFFELKSFQVVSGAINGVQAADNIIPTATVRVAVNNTIVENAASGDGPIDAIFRAIDKCTEIQVKLSEFTIKAHAGGKNAMGDVALIVRCGDHLLNGIGSSTDILDAAAQAYMQAVNKVEYYKRKQTKTAK